MYPARVEYTRDANNGLAFAMALISMVPSRSYANVDTGQQYLAIMSDDFAVLA